MRRRGLRFAVCLALTFCRPCGLARLPADDRTPVGHAVLVGVSRYTSPDLDRLRFPEHDVVALGQVLRDANFESSHIRVMTETSAESDGKLSPTAVNIRRALEQVIAKAAVGDTVVLAFSGHGVQYQDDEESYFCPIDADLTNRESLLPIGEIYSDLERCAADVKLVFVDACRNELDSNTRAARNAKVARTAIPKQRLPPGGMAAFYACSPGEQAYEDHKLSNGVFFHFLVAGLQGQADLDTDRQITLPELEQFVKRKTSAHVEQSFGARQMPELFNRTRGLTPLARWDLPRPGWTSMNTRSVGELGSLAAGVPGPHYPRIDGVIPGSPVDVAGLRAGDVILAIDGKPMSKPGLVAETERTYAPGSVMQFDILRDGETLKISVESEAKPTESEWSRVVQERALAGEAWAMVLTAGHYSSGEGLPQDRVQAYDWYRRAAELGDSVAQNYMGVLYDTGRGVAEDDRAAVDWYRKAALQQNWWGAHNLAGMYKAGTGIAKDEAEAVRWYRAAAEQGLADAQNSLALMYDRGQGVAVNHEEAVRWYRAAADQGLAVAICNLAVSTEDGEGCPKDPELAFRLYQQAAAKDYTPAMYHVGRLLRSGIGTPKDESAGLEWYRRAADAGHALSCWYLGLAYRGGSGVAASDAEAFRWWLRGAELGEDDCRGIVALCYLDGTGVTADESLAARWAKLVENEKSWMRCYVLGTLFESGKVEAQNLNEARRHYELAAEADVERAIIRLASMCTSGQGGPIDLEAAARWYRRGADKGSDMCQFAFGLACKSGRGVPEDPAQARTWFQKAAEQGLAAARTQLGVMYAFGQGGSKDVEQGRKLLSAEALSGDSVAQYWLGLLCKSRGEYVEALEWLEKCVQQGDHDAAPYFAATLTFLSESTIDARKNDAIRWLRAGAEAGHSECQYELGWFYHMGLWVPEDANQAVYWIRKAANQDSGRACSRLGWFYEAGRGVSKDREEAIRWYRKGSLAGDDYSKERLRALGIR